MKKTLLIFLIFAAIFLAAGTVFAGGGSTGGAARKLTEEEKKIVGIWTEPPVTIKKDMYGYEEMVPRFEFYDAGKGYISLGDDGHDFIDSFDFDPETSEYVMTGMEKLKTVVIGRARLVPGKPQKLIISGSFVDNQSDNRIHYKYELVRESDAKKMRAPSSPGGYTVEPQLNWIKGTWKPESGDPIELRFLSDSLVFIRFFDDDGYMSLETSATMEWEDDEKAFAIRDVEMIGTSRKVRNEYGHLRPSAGKNAPSETMEFDCFFHTYGLDRGYRAIMVRESPESISHFPSDIAGLLDGKWTTESGTGMEIVFADDRDYSSDYEVKMDIKTAKLDYNGVTVDMFAPGMVPWPKWNFIESAVYADTGEYNPGGATRFIGKLSSDGAALTVKGVFHEDYEFEAVLIKADRICDEPPFCHSGAGE